MRASLGVVAALAAACARIEPPPGGPIDRAPPLLRSIYPDSLRTLPEFDEDVAFQFDEVVSEGSQPNFGLGSGDLEKLIVLSPSNEVPEVRWKRSRITVRPKEGWRPNTVYRVELLAGVADLSRNLTKGPAVVTFTTGAPLPTDSLVGRVVDWTTQRAVPQGLVEAVLQPDSLVYRTTSDSTGRFKFGPLPRGEYLVYGVVEEGTRNRRLDARERFDTVRVAAGRDSVGEVWAFKHDTTAARIQAASRPDSVTVLVTFNQFLSPYQRFVADSAELLLLPDSTRIPVASFMSQSMADSLAKARTDSLAKARSDSVARARGDTAQVADTARARPEAARAGPDTGQARIVGVPRAVGGVRRPQVERDTVDMAPLKTKPPLFDKLVIRSDSVLREGKRYLVIVRGVQSVSGVTGEARTVLIVEEKRVTPADSARADSARADSARGRPDSIPPAARDSVRPGRDTVPPEPGRPRLRAAALPAPRR
ncbi:MAG TPA: Ig-like domain-containing protein [Gemmatimonadales bacterium]